MTVRPVDPCDRAGSFTSNDSLYSSEVVSPVRMDFLFGQWRVTELLKRVCAKFEIQDNRIIGEFAWPSFLMIRDWRDVHIDGDKNDTGPIERRMVVVPTLSRWHITPAGDLPWVIGQLFHFPQGAPDGPH